MPFRPENRGFTMNKLGMSIMISHKDKMSIENQIRLFSEVGFDSFFLSCGVTNDFNLIPFWSEIAKENNICFEAVHAPSGGANSIWYNDDSAEEYLKQLRQIIDYCHKGRVDKIVMHVSCGIAPTISEIGLERYFQLEKYAKDKGVHICYENGDSVDNMSAVLAHSDDFHGFCLDIGHKECYTPNVPLLNMFKDKLLYTHIHDNLGANLPDGVYKDLHLLPFDGIIDFENFTKTIKGIGYKGTLNLELSANGKTEYNNMTYDDFVKEAYKRLKKLTKL